MILAILIVAAVLTLAPLRRRLPWQNVMMIGVLTTSISLICEALSAFLGFGAPLAAWLKSGKTVWRIDLSTPLLWLILLINVRGVIRSIFGKFGMKDGGLWVLLGTIASVTALWLPITEHGIVKMMAVSAASKFLIALILFLAAFPWMIVKRPQSER